MSEGGAVKKIVITCPQPKKKRGRKTFGKTRKVGGEREIPPSVAAITDKAGGSAVVENVKAAALPTTVVGGKVLLEPKKIKVVLAKADAKKLHVRHNKTRKVHLAINGIHKNIAKAKTIKNRAKDLPLDEIKKELKPCGLWKEGSKAPESMLRNIYADFKILQEKAL